MSLLRFSGSMSELKISPPKEIQYTPARKRQRTAHSVIILDIFTLLLRYWFLRLGGMLFGVGMIFDIGVAPMRTA